MPIQLKNAQLQILVEQLTANTGKLSEADVSTLVEAAYNDEVLSVDEQESLQQLLDEHGALFESESARGRLDAFQSMGHTGLRDAAYRFARDGSISGEEARELKDIALESGSVSRPDRISLKALMGFYSPELEPEAQQVLEDLARPSLSELGDPETVKVLEATLGGSGPVSQSALEEAETRLAATLGPDKAKEVLVRALGQDPARISFEAIDYLQGHIGAMDGHIDRYQDVLLGHLDDAKLLDANFDGTLDENDLIFRKGADGKVNVTRIGKALRDRVLIGSAMVDSAHAMGKAKHRFGDLEANPVVWEIDEDNPNTMHLNPEFSPSVALMDIFKHPEMYQFECATAMVILRYRAMHDLIGEEDFNEICSDLRIGVWDQEDHAEAIWDISGKSAKGEDAEITPETRANLKPGDYAYFKNWDVSEAAFKGGWQGENVIFLGNGQYYGHPFGVTEGNKIVDYLNKHRKTGSTRSASLLDLHARVHDDVLTYDKTPNK